MSKMNENELRRRLDLLSEIKPSPEATDRALDRVRRILSQPDKQLDARPARWGRILMRSKLSKWVVAAAVLVTITVLWQSVRLTGNAYALVDVPHLLGQAKTIHMTIRHFSGDEELRSEYWSDRENGRMYRYWEGLMSEDGPNGRQTVKGALVTVCDGQFIMKIDHHKKTATFERLLASQQESRRLVMADRASTGTLQDIRNFDQYTKADEGQIDGQQYDIWRRDWKLAGSESRRFRHEYWISPATGAVGRMRRWHRQDPAARWELLSETDRIETDVAPPTDLFRAEPPAGYALETPKATAELAGLDLDAFRSVEGHTLRTPASFTLEDGSVLVCWRGTHDSTGAGPDVLYENLTFGGDLPRAPAELFALISHPDENDPKPLVHYVGRHLMVTRREGRIYIWALYVPQKEVTVEGVSSHNIEFIRLNTPPNREAMQQWGLSSFVVTAHSFVQYVPAVMQELSDAQTVPAGMAYDNLLALARQIRDTPDLYEASRNAVTEAWKHVAVLEPVKPVEIATPEQVRQQARQLVEAFFAAIVDGRDADAARLLRYEEPRASRVVTGMKEVLGVKDIKVEDIYATEENALVITNEFAAYEGGSGRWAIGIRKEKGTWRIGDFDATTTEKMQEEIDDYLKHFPNAKHFPER